MTDHDPWDEPMDDETATRVVLRRPVRESGDLDITPMIDITFLLLIFFLVASVPDYQKAVQLPPARHGTGVSEKSAVVISVFETGPKSPAEVFLGDGRTGRRLSADAATQEQEILQAVDEGLNAGRPNILIKAEREVRHREVSRVAAAASQVEGVKQLYVAVMEID